MVAIASPAAARIKISVRDLGMSFRADGKEVRVLDDVHLEVRDGEFVCLLGPSGCGKSTLLNIVAGFLTPTTGEVRIDGEPVRGPDVRRIFVFQERGVLPWLTVEGNNIGFGLRKTPAAERRAIVDHYIKLVGLSGFERAYPDELSGGMKQRVEVARALAVNPDVLYRRAVWCARLHHAHPDAHRAAALWEAEKKTILFVTHDIDESVQIADRVVVMSTRPARVRRIVEIELPHPRDLSSRRYLELRDSILAEIGLAHRI